MDMFLNITEFWLQFYFFSLQKFLQMHYKLKKRKCTVYGQYYYAMQQNL